MRARRRCEGSDRIAKRHLFLNWSKPYFVDTEKHHLGCKMTPVFYRRHFVVRPAWALSIGCKSQMVKATVTISLPQKCLQDLRLVLVQRMLEVSERQRKILWSNKVDFCRLIW